MDNPPELWAFLLANLLLFVSSSVLTGLCWLAYRQRRGGTTYLIATVGFGLVVLGGLVEPVYQFSIRDGYGLSGTELLWIETGEGVLIAAGLGLLFSGIVRYSPDSAPTSDDRGGWADRDVSWGDPGWDGDD